MFQNIKRKFLYNYYKIVAKHKAKKTYPESISLNLEDLLARPRPIKVAILDDQAFPWISALESRGCVVTYFADYTKPIKQANQKVKAHDLSSQDLIICDIHDVGSAMYPGMDGLGVMEDLRRKNPLQMIVAYTGNPGAIYSKMKKQDVLDKVFSRDWTIDDFLLNFDELRKAFREPQHRWDFIKTRLNHLAVSEQKIEEIRVVYVESVLLSQMLKDKLNFSAAETKALVLKSQTSAIDYAGLTKFGISAAEFGGFISPFIMDAIK